MRVVVGEKFWQIKVVSSKLPSIWFDSLVTSDANFKLIVGIAKNGMAVLTSRIEFLALELNL